jgi:hypothetical protein
MHERERPTLLENVEELSSCLDDAENTPQRIEDAGPTPLSDAEWRVCNDRRIALIGKQFSLGLTPAEAAELQDLQAEADRRLHESAPLPFEHLERMEEYVRRLTGNADGQEGVPDRP